MTDASGSPRRTSTFDMGRLTDDVISVVIAVPAVAVGAVAVGAVAVGTGLTSIGATVGEASTHCMELATAQLTATATEHRKRYPEQSSRPWNRNATPPITLLAQAIRRGVTPNCATTSAEQKENKA